MVDRGESLCGRLWKTVKSRQLRRDHVSGGQNREYLEANFNIRDPLVLQTVVVIFTTHKTG